MGDTDWDIVLFSGTRNGHGHCHCQLDHAHLLWKFSLENVSVLLHNRHCNKGKEFHAWSGRVASLELAFATMRVIAVYMPRAGYSHDYSRSVYDQVQACVDEALTHT